MGDAVVEVRRRIAAPASKLFGLLSDPDQMPRWNPAFDRVEWLHGARESEKGARFQVHNVDARFEWSVDECVIIENDGVSAFAFVFVVGDRESALQRFTVHADGAVTEVVAAYERRWQPWPDRLRALVGDRDADVRRGLQLALEELERIALAP